MTLVPVVVGAAVAIAGISVTVVLFVFGRITARFDAQAQATSDQHEMLRRKLGRQSKALTQLTQAQRVQTHATRKLVDDSEQLEDAVSELKSATRLLDHRMSQHEQWHRDALAAITADQHHHPPTGLGLNGT